MIKNTAIGVLVIVVVVLSWIVFEGNTQKTSVTTKFHTVSALSGTGDITCTYPQILHVSYQNEEVSHELPKPETNPIIMTFSDIDSENPKIRFIDSTQTISEVPVIKILDSAEKLVFIEGTGDPYMTLHTVFKDSGVATFAKEVSLLGTPVGTLSMGTCIDS